ncbi:hypothetical protein AQUCO_07800037v1 [Aquilegia coerulea]|uniref:PGG domain-containing protein n=1 Tax=Aquilegia coerulea TaxID=218851 RepID=A0A2G5C808_AQUCA|nr:hypothetical protein AQUCO_07800037v1 [Aquilegia coerulea]
MGDLDFFKEAPLDVILNARNNDDDTVLSVVIYENHLDCCAVICERCPSLVFHQTSTYGYFALGHAAYRERLEMMKLIISAGVKADSEDQQDISTQGVHKTTPRKTALTLRSHKGETAMHFSVHNYKSESVKLLIEADPNAQLLRIASIEDDTPLHDAVGPKSNHQIAKLLIEADPDFPYGANSQGKTPLLIAIEKAELYDSPDMLKLILELQPSQSKVCIGKKGWAALHYAVSIGFLTSVGDIIRSCPESSEVVDNEGQNFLHLATKLGNVEMLKYILEMKVIASTVLNRRDNVGRTSLDAAVLTGQESITQCLLEDPRVDKKLTVTKDLQWVVEKHNFVMMNLLIEANPDFLKDIDLEVLLNSRDENGDTILFKGVQENHLILCKEIYKRCPSLIYHQSKDGRTALHDAAWTGEAKMLKFLITAGAKSYNEEEEEDIERGAGEKVPQKMLLSMVDEQGDTALHKAVLNHKLEAVKLLIEADNDFEYATNNSGETPLMIAIREAQSNENKRDSGITVPGGYISDVPNQGTAVLSKKGSFIAFIISNSFALLFSLYAVFSHFCARSLSDEADIKYQLKVATLCTLAAIYCMMVAFIAGSFAVLANSNWLALVVCTISFLFFIFSCRPIWKIAMQRKRSAAASRHKRSPKRSALEE